MFKVHYYYASAKAYICRIKTKNGNIATFAPCYAKYTVCDWLFGNIKEESTQVMDWKINGISISKLNFQSSYWFILFQQILFAKIFFFSLLYVQCLFRMSGEVYSIIGKKSWKFKRKCI